MGLAAPRGVELPAGRPGPRASALLHDAAPREEKEAAELLGIPDNVMQGALIPVAHTLGGTDFKPGPRRDLDRIIHTDGW